MQPYSQSRYVHTSKTYPVSRATVAARQTALCSGGEALSNPIRSGHPSPIPIPIPIEQRPRHHQHQHHHRRALTIGHPRQMAIRHHLGYGSASRGPASGGGSHARRGPLFLRLPECLFLGALGLFLFTTQLQPTAIIPSALLQQPPSAAPVQVCRSTHPARPSDPVADSPIPHNPPPHSSWPRQRR